MSWVRRPRPRMCRHECDHGVQDSGSRGHLRCVDCPDDFGGGGGGICPGWSLWLRLRFGVAEKWIFTCKV